MIEEKPIQSIIKRCLDVTVAVLLLVVLSPMLAVLYALVLSTIGSPVLFRQERVGYRDKPFYILKFRTMTNETDAFGNLLPDHERRHGVGKWIRSWSLDELPQLWNVLVGDMSLIGPRPLIEQDMKCDIAGRRIRHLVRPGVTGLAQISGRNSIAWEEKLALDSEYVRHWSLWMDMKIMLRTLPIVIRREGIDAHPESYMRVPPLSSVPEVFSPILVRETGT